MKEQLSFTTLVKEELTTKPFSEERLRSLLSAYIRINGRLHISSDEYSLILNSENAKTAKFIFKIIQQIYGISARFSYVKSMRFNRKKTTFSLHIVDSVDDILSDLQIDFLDGKISKSLTHNDDMIGGYLAGAFLASGSVNSPLTSNYHLEIAVDNDNYAKWLSKLINHFNDNSFNSKVSERRGKYLVYLKKSDLIADFLILIGATDSCMEFENIRVDRDFSNVGNRLQNCDQANFTKTMSASKQQIEDIKIIERTIGIKNLTNEKQKEVCKIRLEREELSMLEIADILSKKLNTQVTKSNVAHIFRKIHEIAEQYR